MKKRKAPSKKVVQLMERVEKQLKEMQKPVWTSTAWEEPWKFRQSTQSQKELTLEEYRSLDPFWLSTMTGKFAGRPAKLKQEKP